MSESKDTESLTESLTESIKTDGEQTTNTTTSKVSHAMTGDGNVSMASFKLLLLVLMVLQNSSAVLVGRYTRSNRPQDDMYEVSHLILICEAVKFILSCALEAYGQQGKFMESVQTHILSNPLEALKISVPALLYVVQNSLLYVALSNLTAPVFQVAYQCKLVTTAVVSVIMLNRVYNSRQWVSLVGISMGVAVVVLGERKAEDEEKDAEKDVNLGTGLVAVSVACLSSALAGVYFEKVLKKPSEGADKPAASVWMRNMQLAFFSVVIALCQGGLKDTGKSYLHGFDMWVWILVGLQSGGGLLVAAVIKYADNVLKGLATGVSVVLSSALSMVFFATPLGPKFGVGAVVILTSVWFFSNPLPAACSAKMKAESEGGNLLPK